MNKNERKAIYKFIYKMLVQKSLKKLTEDRLSSHMLQMHLQSFLS